MFPRSSLKTCRIWYTRLLNPFSRIYADLTFKPVGMCAKGQIVLEFSLMWIRITCLLAFHVPWDRSDLIFHYPIDELYKEPFGYIKGIWEIESKKTIVHCCWSLYLSLHPFVPWSTFVFFPRFPFACDISIERWRIEVVEAQVGDSVSSIHRHVDRGCIHCNLWFYIIRNIFSCPIVYIWMNIWSMDDFKCLYVIDYIC